MKYECLCDISDQLFKRIINRNYIKYTLQDIEKIGIKFDIIDTFISKNTDIEIFLCNHIQKFEFLYFLDFLMSYYLPNREMTVNKFYNDNNLCNSIKMILFSLSQSKDIEYFDLYKVSFHFSKQEIFSEEFLKIISQKYLEIFFAEIENFSSFFLEEMPTFHQYIYEMLYNGEDGDLWILNDENSSFIFQKVSENLKCKNLFILLLNTFNIKYLHIYNFKEKNENALYFFLQNIKKKIEEIVFYKLSIYDKLIISLNNFLNILDPKKIIFLDTYIKQDLKLTEHLIILNKYIFFDGCMICDTNKIKNENIIYKIDSVKDIIMNSQQGEEETQIFSMKNTNRWYENTDEKVKNLYSNLFEMNQIKENVKIFESLNLTFEFCGFGCFYESNGDFHNISITLNKLKLKQFLIKDRQIEKNIKEIITNDSEIDPNFLNDIFNITELESLTINNSEPFIGTYINLNNKYVKYFSFNPKNDENCRYFFVLVAFMKNLREIYLKFYNEIVFISSYTRSMYIEELIVHKNNFLFNLNSKSILNSILDFNRVEVSLNQLFEKNLLKRIYKLALEDMIVYKKDSGAFRNLSNLKDLKISEIYLSDICFSELFCNSKEYKIEKLYFYEISIKEIDLEFISRLRKLKDLIFNACYIPKNASFYIKISFLNEIYLEIWYKKILILKDLLMKLTKHFPQINYFWIIVKTIGKIQKKNKF
ncbi:hypothetical protein CWI36_0839p0010 [Hamiltosporidium magnivora]|uniref:Uncharacterized protein n=1 Tax=Hamiltosporidium magnivora TaxID=148818 RepID=A0A4Q9L8K0_9MICR|nr:hypothetical protein CWI36_0839p0010 [Hamiltosporidium magnivora]